MLLVAALVWTFAGGMLLYRGYTLSNPLPAYWEVKLFMCLIAGLIFFLLLFNRISAKHVRRIRNLPQEQPGVFSFFNLKSYVMMLLMLTLGVSLRKSGAIAPEYLSLLYVTMGIPLLMSSFRFYHSFFTFRIVRVSDTIKPA